MQYVMHIVFPVQKMMSYNSSNNKLSFFGVVLHHSDSFTMMHFSPAESTPCYQ